MDPGLLFITNYIHINVLITSMVTDLVVQSVAIHLIRGSKGVKFEVLAFTSMLAAPPSKCSDADMMGPI